MPEGSHNGIAAVLKTAGRKPVGVRVSRPPLLQKKSLCCTLRQGLLFFYHNSAIMRRLDCFYADFKENIWNEPLICYTLSIQ